MLPFAVFVVSRNAIRQLMLAAVMSVVTVIAADGQVRSIPAGVANVTVSAPVTQRPTPSVFAIPITVSDTTGQGIIAFQFVLSYDAGIIDPSGTNFGCSASGISAAAGHAATCNVQPDGTLKVSVSGANSLSGSGAVLNLSFRTDAAAVAGNVSPLNFSAVHFYNTAGEVASGFSNGSVTLVTGPTAASVTVAGRLVSPEGRAIRAGQVVLTDEAGVRRSVSIALRGEFRFDDVASGRTYTVSASSRRFRFEPVVLDLVADVVALDLVGRMQ